MNRVYRVIWNNSTRTWQAVSEIGRFRGASAAKSLIVAAALGLSIVVSQNVAASGLPDGGQITSGAGSIKHTANQLTIHQATDRMALDWKSFSIGQDKTVQFIQPSAQAAIINRVSGVDASIIAGKLLANGTVVLLNPNGILFTPSAQVNVGALVASTLQAVSKDFSSGKLILEGDSKASIINGGTITAAQGGSIALIAAQVKNQGEISAPGGRVTLAAAGKVRIDFGGPVDLEIDQGILDAQVEQGGIIRAAGGRILLTAKTLNQLMQTVVNHTGISEALSAREVNGEIVLDGGSNGQVQVSGSVNASGINSGQSGGQIKVFGQTIHVKDSARLNVTGDRDGGQLYVGGGWQGASVDGKPSAEQVRIESGATLDASSLVNGSGGTVVAWSDISNSRSLTEVYGTLLSRGGRDAGSGGRIETSGYRLIVDGITVNTAAPKGNAGEWLLDPYDIKIENVTETPNLAQSGTDPKTISPPGNTTIIRPSTIMEALKTSNVTITTGNSGSQAGDITIMSQVIQPSYSISVNGTQTTQQFQLPAERTLTLKAARSIIFNDGTGIDATLNQNTQKLNVILWADSDASGGGNVVMKGSSTAGVTIRTRGGGLWIGGGSESTTNNWAPSGTTATMKVGIGPAEGYIDSSVSDFQKSMGVSMDYTTITTGSGNVTIIGRGSNSTDGFNKGVRLFESAIETNTGSIAISGQGGGTASSTNGYNTGIYIYKYSSSTNTTTAPSLLSNSGTILLEGRGGNTDATSAANDGVSLIGDNPLIRTTGSGAIEIKGTSGNVAMSSTTPSHGVHLSGQAYGSRAALIEAAGTGSITLFGSATRDGVGRTGGKQTGLLISQADVTANGGTISLEGLGSNQGSANNTNISRGVVLENATVASISGEIRVVGKSFSTSATPSPGVELSTARLGTAASGSTDPRGSITINADHLKIGRYVSPYDSLNYPSSSSSPATTSSSIIKTNSFNLILSPALSSRVVINSAPASVSSELLIGTTENVISLRAAPNESSVESLKRSLTLKSPGDLVFTENSRFPVFGEPVNAVLWANNSGNGGSVVLRPGVTLNTSGGDIWIGGGSGASSWNGLNVGDGVAKGTLSSSADGIAIDGAKISTGGGSIRLSGAAASGCTTVECFGIAISSTSEIDASTVSSSGGNLTFSGQTQTLNGMIKTAGVGTISLADAETIQVSGTLETASGNITANATSGMTVTSSGAIKSAGGDITITTPMLTQNGLIKTASTAGDVFINTTSRSTGASVAIGGTIEVADGVIAINKDANYSTFGAIQFKEGAVIRTALTTFSPGANASVVLQSAELASGAIPGSTYTATALPKFTANNPGSGKMTFSAGVFETKSSTASGATASPIIFASGDVEITADKVILGHAVQMGATAGTGGGISIKTDSASQLERLRGSRLLVQNPAKTIQISCLTPCPAVEKKTEISTVAQEVASIVKVAAITPRITTPVAVSPPPVTPPTVVAAAPVTSPAAPASTPSAAPQSQTAPQSPAAPAAPGPDGPTQASGSASSGGQQQSNTQTSSAAPAGQSPPPSAPTGPSPAPTTPATGAAQPPAPTATTTAPPAASSPAVTPPPPVAPPPPSPVAAQKPPTPRDTADAGDRTLASAAPPPPPPPAEKPQRTAVRAVPVSPVVSVQVPPPPRPVGRQAVDQRVSMQGNSGRW